MKKPINLKPLMNLYTDVTRLESDYTYYHKCDGEYWQKKAERIKAEWDTKRTDLANMISEKLTPVIAEAEGRSSARTLDPKIIFPLLSAVEKKLGITKKAMEGIRIWSDPFAQRFPNAYKYIPESTHFTAEYKRGAWWLTDVVRGTCKSGPRVVIYHTEASKAALIDVNSRLD